MGERQEIYSGTEPVRERHRIDPARLEAWMREHVPGFRGRLELLQFKGGQSNPTYRVEAGGTRYVVRRKPPGQLLPSAHAVDREYRVISALAGTSIFKVFAAVIGTALPRRKPAKPISSTSSGSGRIAAIMRIGSAPTTTATSRSSPCCSASQ